jgi:hypothetical protein
VRGIIGKHKREGHLYINYGREQQYVPHLSMGPGVVKNTVVFIHEEKREQQTRRDLWIKFVRGIISKHKREGHLYMDYPLLVVGGITFVDGLGVSAFY